MIAGGRLVHILVARRARHTIIRALVARIASARRDITAASAVIGTDSTNSVPGSRLVFTSFACSTGYTIIRAGVASIANANSSRLRRWLT